MLRKLLLVRTQTTSTKLPSNTIMEVDEDFPAAAPVVSNSNSNKEFDLESYIANYTGHTKIDRLVFIAEHSKQLELEAYKAALDELKKTTNTAAYKRVADTVGDRLGPAYRTDQAWIDNVDKRAAQQTEKLEQDLSGYKANLVKESIRVGHNDLGDFYYNRGDLSNAMKCYVRTRDYCTTSKHIIHLCLNVIRVSLEMNNYSHVTNYVSKAEQTPDVGDASIQPKLKACSGLANLENRKYKIAAQKFLETNFNLTDFSDVISPQDIAIYGGLCALATFDRSELKKKVIDNQAFRNFLELVPEVREMINDFYASRYKSCLGNLEKLRPDLQLDIHLHDHIETLYQKIRNKALIQYFSPFISVDLTAMATAFNTTVAPLEKELARLIMDGSISARIDSHNKRLYARHTDQRSATFQNALRVGEEYQRNANALLLRVNLMRNDFVIKPPRREDIDK